MLVDAQSISIIWLLVAGVTPDLCRRWCAHAEKEMNSKIKLIDGIEGEVGIELKVDGKLLSVDDAETWLCTHTKADGNMGIEGNVNVGDEADLDRHV